MLCGGCLVSMASSLACGACCVVAKATSTATRLTYGLLLLASSLLCLFCLTGGAEKLLAELPTWPTGIQTDMMKDDFGKVTTKTYVVPGQVVGTLAVFRVTLGAALFHGIQALVLTGVKNSADPRARLQNGAWGIKFVVWVALVVGMFFVPNEVPQAFIGVAKVGGTAFIMVQLFLLVTFAYDAQGNIVAHMEESESAVYGCIAWAMLLGTYLTAVAMAIVLITNGANGDCSTNIWVTCVTLFLCIFVSLASISNIVRTPTEGNADAEQNGLLQSGVVTMYVFYLVTSGFNESTDASCNALARYSGGSGMSATMGSVLTFAAIVYSTIRNASRGEVAHDEEEGTALTNVGGGDDEDGDGKPHDDEVEECAYSYSFFHVTFMLAACYIACLLTGWGDVDGTQTKLSIAKSDSAMWVKIGTAWACLFLYAWSLLAPYICSGRDFS